MINIPASELFRRGRTSEKYVQFRFIVQIIHDNMTNFCRKSYATTPKTKLKTCYCFLYYTMLCWLYTKYFCKEGHGVGTTSGPLDSLNIYSNIS